MIRGTAVPLTLFSVTLPRLLLDLRQTPSRRLGCSSRLPNLIVTTQRCSSNTSPKHCPERLQLKLAETGLKSHLVITLNRLPLSMPDTRDFLVHLEHHPELSPARKCTCTQTPRHPTLLCVCALPVSLAFSSHDSTSESDMSIPLVSHEVFTIFRELEMNNQGQCESVQILVQQMRMEEWEDTVEGRLVTDRKGDWGGGVVSNWMVLRNLVGLTVGQFGWMTTVASQVPAWSTCASDRFTCLVGGVSSS
ncbi:hypothetical protein BLNAU_7434 [Blattamonas nauphoetae]|uniref:Uncharacterized protein n=1 Tax=Blattamonas nauphoetae TaxID=2049346 RepID=A0ABQ9Y1C7_9EUKA|nr:hypothetical protein BLNAU_7434 [Blattamonas nauphoetae]